MRVNGVTTWVICTHEPRSAKERYAPVFCHKRLFGSVPFSGIQHIERSA